MTTVIPKLLAYIQEGKQRSLSQRSHQVCENARLIKQIFHKVSLWGPIFSSYSPEEVSDASKLHEPGECLHTKDMQP